MYGVIPLKDWQMKNASNALVSWNGEGLSLSAIVLNRDLKAGGMIAIGHRSTGPITPSMYGWMEARHLCLRSQYRRIG